MRSVLLSELSGHGKHSTSPWVTVGEKNFGGHGSQLFDCPTAAAILPAGQLRQRQNAISHRAELVELEPIAQARVDVGHKSGSTPGFPANSTVPLLNVDPVHNSRVAVEMLGMSLFCKSLKKRQEVHEAIQACSCVEIAVCEQIDQQSSPAWAAFRAQCRASGYASLAHSRPGVVRLMWGPSMPPGCLKGWAAHGRNGCRCIAGATGASQTF